MLRNEELIVGVLPRVEYRDGSVILVLLEKWTRSVKEVCRYVKRRGMDTAHFMVRQCGYCGYGVWGVHL